MLRGASSCPLLHGRSAGRFGCPSRRTSSTRLLPIADRMCADLVAGSGILSSCYARARSDGALPATAAGGGGRPSGRPGLGGVGGGGAVGPRGCAPHGSGRPRRPMVSETAPPSPRERIAYRAFATVGWLGRTLPTRTGRMLFRWAGSLAYHVASRARSTVAANQAMVLGRSVDDPLVQAVTKEAFRRYARYWFDA